MTTIYKPIFVIDSLGELGQLPDGGITNIGGVVGPTFTVGGKGLLFDDGTSTGSGSGGLPAINLQTAYGASGIPAQINLTAGKNFVLNALNGKKLVFDAAVGTVLIEGDLTVLGESSIIEGTVSNLDQVNIRPPNGTTVGLTIQPSVAVTPLVNLVEIRKTNGGPLVFSVGPTGITNLADLVVTGTFNGVAASAITGHIDDTPIIKHSADQVSFDDTELENISGETVQEAIESIDSKLQQVITGGVVGFEFTQLVPVTTWDILHNKNSSRVQITVWDEENEVLLADRIKIINSNEVRVLFSSPQAGRAVLMIF